MSTNTLKNQIIQVGVRFGRTVQLIRNAPQMVFHLTEFFEDKSCDLTIQVNFSTLATYPIILNKESHSWRLELKEWLILVATQASAIEKSVKAYIAFSNIRKLFSHNDIPNEINTFYRYYHSFYFHLLHSKGMVNRKNQNLLGFLFAAYLLLIAI
jgi:hypothetical protein